MDDLAPPTQTPSLLSYQLEPVSTSKFLRPVKELKMVGMPSSAPELYGLFQTTGKEPPIVLWIGDEDCCVHDWKTDQPAGYLLQFKWFLFQRGVHASPLYLNCATIEGAIRCLDALLGLAMGHLDASLLSWLDAFDDAAHDEERDPPPCPFFTAEILEKYLRQNIKGKCSFWSMTLTPDQCTTLATAGRQTHLYFDNCQFQDRGTAFAEAYRRPENCDSGPAKLEFHSTKPMDDTHLAACVEKLHNVQKLQEVILEYTDDVSARLGQALVSADLNYLHLNVGSLESDETVDPEQILIENIRHGRGPRGISLNPSIFGSRNIFVEFCSALLNQKEHQYLKRLELSSIGFDARAETLLRELWQGSSLGLTRFALTSSEMTEQFWNSLLGELAIQPSLQVLDFHRVTIPHSTATPQERTEQLYAVILKNQHIQEMDFCQEILDEGLWKTRVVPALEHNAHRERFVKIQQINVGPRKAILGRAAKKVSDRPSLLYFLLHENLDVIANSVADLLGSKRSVDNGELNDMQKKPRV